MRTRTFDLGLLRRFVDKLVVGPIKYRSSRGYDAHRYWDDRLKGYGTSIRGVGHEGLSDSANEQMYAEAGAVFETLVRPLVGEQPPRTLEIGTGTGFYTGLLHGLGVTDYTGVDITDALFRTLRERFDGYRFVRADITSDTVAGQFDLVVMIDVTEHIVTREGLEAAVSHIKGATAPGGTVVIGPQFEKSGRHLFYVHFWSVEDLDNLFDGWQRVAGDEFRGGTLLAYGRP